MACIKLFCTHFLRSSSAPDQEDNSLIESSEGKEVLNDYKSRPLVFQLACAVSRALFLCGYRMILNKVSRYLDVFG